jgi:hypothetical protein
MLRRVREQVSAGPRGSGFGRARRKRRGFKLAREIGASLRLQQGPGARVVPVWVGGSLTQALAGSAEQMKVLWWLWPLQLLLWACSMQRSVCAHTHAHL